MRKIISLGLFALSFGCFSNSSFATQVEECDVLMADAPKGLFGLCIAYHNADNGRSQVRIEELYIRKATAAGYSTVIPGTEEEMLPCPCWTDNDLALAIIDESEDVKTCGTDTSYDFFYVGENTSSSFRKYKFESGELIPSVFYCDFAGPSGFDFQLSGFNEVTIEDIKACNEQLRAIDMEVDCTFSE